MVNKKFKNKIKKKQHARIKNNILRKKQKGGEKGGVNIATTESTSEIARRVFGQPFDYLNELKDRRKNRQNELTEKRIEKLMSPKAVERRRLKWKKLILKKEQKRVLSARRKINSDKLKKKIKRKTKRKKYKVNLSKN